MMGVAVNKFSLTLLIFATVLTACRPELPAPSPTTITLQLRWTHSAQSAGNFAADQNEYYTAEKMLREQGMLAGPVEPSQPYTLKFFEDVNKS